MIDASIILFVLLMALLGLFRGIVSQIMALAGLALAYFIAPAWGPTIGGFVQDQLSWSLFMAEKLSVLMVGITVYLAARLFGFGIEKMLVNRVREFKKLNRLGGAAMGGVKGLVLVVIAFCFLALLPSGVMQDWFPRLRSSYAYALAAKYNPMGDATTLERMRQIREAMQDPKKMKRLRDDPEAQKIFAEHKVGNPFRDHRFLQNLHEGDFDKLQKRDEMEALMQDDRLENLIANLEESSD